MRDELDALLEQVRALDEREGSVAALGALKRTPFEDQALYFAALGTLAARTGSAHEAIEAFAQACRLEPGSAVARTMAWRCSTKPPAHWTMSLTSKRSMRRSPRCNAPWPWMGAGLRTPA